MVIILLFQERSFVAQALLLLVFSFFLYKRHKKMRFPVKKGNLVLLYSSVLSERVPQGFRSDV